MAHLMELSAAIDREVKRRRAKLRHQRARYTRMLAKIRATHTTTDKVKLQLRSDRHRFTTTKATLTRLPGMLQAKFAGELWKGDVDEESGCVFISKDGLVFEHILNVLRGGYDVPILSGLEAETFKNDLDYFGLTEQVAKMEEKKLGGKWKWNSVGMGNLLQLSANDMCVTKNGVDQHTQSTVLGTMKFEAGRGTLFNLNTSNTSTVRSSMSGRPSSVV